MNPMDEHLHAQARIMKQPYGTFDAFLALGMFALVILLAIFCVVGLGAAAWWVIR